MNFDRRQQASALVAFVAFAYFASHTLHLHNEKAKSAAKSIEASAQATGSTPGATSGAATEPPSVSTVKELVKPPKVNTDEKSAKRPSSNRTPEVAKKQIDRQEAVRQPGQDRSVKIGDNATVTGSPITTGDNSPITITQIPPPQFLIGEKSIKTLPDQENTFVHSAMLTVIYQTVLPELRVEAHHPGIQRLDVAPQRTGVSMSGHAGKREGFCFETLQSVYGKYMLTATVKGEGEVKFQLYP